jgi:(p)ppGpp synthase/HD superfamily hydrolase
MILIDKAKDFALKAHGNQMYGDELYIYHLESVYYVLREFGITSENLLASAYLHDTIEDTKISYQDIKREFGYEVAEIVYGVTDELGRNRSERHQKTYPKTALNPQSVILKLADRISNVRASRCWNIKLDMYEKEHFIFKGFLYDGNNLTMWAELDILLSKEK